MTGFEEIAAKETELYKLMLTNTSIGSVLSGNEKILVDVLKGAAHVGGDSWVESGILDNVKSLLDMSLSDDAVFASMEVFNAAFVAEKISTAEKEEIRQKVLKQYTGLLSTERYREGRRRARVELAIQYLEGPYATAVSYTHLCRISGFVVLTNVPSRCSFKSHNLPPLASITRVA